MRYSSRSPKKNLPRLTLYFLGTIYLALGTILALLGIAALALREQPLGFLLAAVLGLALGMWFRRLGDAKQEPTRAESLLTIAVLWLLIPALSAVPFWLSGGMNYLDAYFEAMSGFTTTGATALADFTQFGYVLFFHRSLIQWLGGVGVLVLVAAILTQLALAGRQIFMTEGSSAASQKEAFTLRLRSTAQSVLRVYAALTVACALCYGIAGVPWFEAVCNALTTISAGGFSPNPHSFADYPPLAQWFATVFMFLSGANFLLLFALFFKQRPKALLSDIEFRVYTLIVLVTGLLLSVYLVLNPSKDMSYGWGEALRHAFFNITSTITTSGYASTNFALWSPAAQTLLVAAMFVGGCAGSVAGGIKVIRLLIIGAIVRRELLRSLHPQAVLTLRLGSRSVSEDVMRSVSAFITLYVVLLAAGALVVSLMENNFVTGFTAAAAAIANIGPGLGDVGPMSSYAGLEPISKIVLIILMWAGRIELIPVFLLLTPELWKRLRG